MRFERLLLVTTLAACSGSSAKPAEPPDEKPVRQDAAAAPVPVGGLVDMGDDHSGPRRLVFTDDGYQLIGYDDLSPGHLVAIDPLKRKFVAKTYLSSSVAPDPNSRVGLDEDVQWKVEEAVWGWDANAKQLVGVVSLSSRGLAVTGLAKWAPASGVLPVAIQRTNNRRPCSLLALSADLRLVAVRAATAAERFCEKATEVEVIDVLGIEDFGQPLKVPLPHVASFSRDGRYVASGNEEVVVEDLARREVFAIRASGKIRSISMAPDSPRVAWSTWDDRVELWDLEDEEPRQLGTGTNVAFSPDGRFLALVDRYLAVLDATSLEPIYEIPLNGNFTHSADSLVFSDDGRQIALRMGSLSHDLYVWQLEPVAAAPERIDWFASIQRLPTPDPTPPPTIEHDGKIAGKVLFDGAPVVGAEVTLHPDRNEYPDAFALEPIVTRTDKHGAFHFDATPTINWWASVVAPGYLRSGFKANLRKATTLEIDDVKLKEAVTIVGTVINSKKKPVARARIVHPPSAGGSADEVEVYADKKGRFLFDHLPTSPSDYLIVARGPDGAVRSEKVKIDKTGKVKVKIKLLPITDERVFRVVVVDPTGAPLKGALVNVGQKQWGLTDDEGRYSIDYDLEGGNSKPEVRVMSTHSGTKPVQVSLPLKDPLTIQTVLWNDLYK